MTMKKVLFTSHVANFVKFNRPYMDWFKEKGWQVDYASCGEEDITGCDNLYVVPFNRSPWSRQNIKAYRQLKEIIMREKYDIIHTHTPMGSVITRLAAIQARKKYGTRVIYTAHGLHFFKGAPLINWLIYYPVEKLLSRYTDCLIVINDEDYRTVNKHHFRAGRIEKIDGVGVDLRKFNVPSEEEKSKLREEYGYKADDYIVICVAEFIHRKNHRFIIDAADELLKTIPQTKLLLAGKGEQLENCKKLVEDKGITNQVEFLGYRNDIDKLCSISDVLISASYQEGLPINVIEAMACGLPVVCTAIRGQTDAVKDGVNGILFKVNDMDACVKGLIKIHDENSDQYKIVNRKTAEKYSLERSISAMGKIYSYYM